MFSLGGLKALHAKELSEPRKQTEITNLRNKFLAEANVCIDDVGLLIVDEISYINCELMANLDQHLRVMLGNRDVWFGGLPVLLAGDFHQMESPGIKQPIFERMVLFSCEDSSVACCYGVFILTARVL